MQKQACTITQEEMHKALEHFSSPHIVFGLVDGTIKLWFYCPIVMIKVVFLFKVFKQIEIPLNGEQREMGLGADYTQHCEECSDGSCSLV